jgi:hypothetical protein
MLYGDVCGIGSGITGEQEFNLHQGNLLHKPALREFPDAGLLLTGDVHPTISQIDITPELKTSANAGCPGNSDPPFHYKRKGWLPAIMVQLDYYWRQK